MLEHHSLFLILACSFGFFMAWGVGANDVANAMGTSVGSNALSIRKAIIIAAIFEFSGAYLAGGQVTQTISKGIVDPQAFIATPELFIFGMLASLLAAGTWLLLATSFGWPVSTTHSIVGSIVGFTVVGIGVQAVQWGKIGTIAASWVVSPIMGGVIAYFLFMSCQVLIFDTDNPFENAKRYIPGYIFAASLVVAMVTFTKGFKHLGLHLTLGQSLVYSVIFGLLVTSIGIANMRRLRRKAIAHASEHYLNVERAFAVLMAFTACAMAFAHGSNDVANAVGPIAAILHAIDTTAVYRATVPTPSWVLLLGGIGIVTGLVTYGHRVIQTVGTGITELTPSRGFAATMAAATTVVVASGTGLPISTTHTLVGAVLGVGLARGIGAINMDVIKAIFTSWLITLPAGALLAIIFFELLRLL